MEVKKLLIFLSHSSTNIKYDTLLKNENERNEVKNWWVNLSPEQRMLVKNEFYPCVLGIKWQEAGTVFTYLERIHLFYFKLKRS